jgi:mannose-6-phosphate isomerase
MKEKNPNLYPLKFEPILKHKVWGGNKLNLLLNKEEGENIGESWEISDVDQNISIVHNGPLKGKSLKWILQTYKDKLVGPSYQHFGDKFPLLFKFIDARDDLSVQVHPEDELAQRRHNSFGKTEMWYVLDGEKDSRLIVGFKKKVSLDDYQKALSENKITDLLNSEIVQKGDAFMILPGTVHAIGAGVLLAEIQQTSDITYRIYDWDRPDIDGNMRELHNDLAMEAIDFSSSKAKLDYNEQINIPVHIGKTQFFEVNKLTLSKAFVRDLSSIPSFKVYMCVGGEAILECEGFSETIVKGETILVPAQLGEIKFDTSSASFLEVYIP